MSLQCNDTTPTRRGRKTRLLQVWMDEEDYALLQKLAGRGRVSEVVRDLIKNYITAEIPDYHHIEEEVERKKKELALLEYQLQKAKELEKASEKVVKLIRSAFKKRAKQFEGLNLFINWLNSVKFGEGELARLTDDQIMDLLKIALPPDVVNRIEIKNGYFRLSESEKERWR